MGIKIIHRISNYKYNQKDCPQKGCPFLLHFGGGSDAPARFSALKFVTVVALFRGLVTPRKNQIPLPLYVFLFYCNKCNKKKSSLHLKCNNCNKKKRRFFDSVTLKNGKISSIDKGFSSKCNNCNNCNKVFKKYLGSWRNNRILQEYMVI